MDTKWELGPKGTMCEEAFGWIELWESKSGRKFNLYWPENATDFGIDTIDQLGEVGLEALRGGTDERLLKLDEGEEIKIRWHIGGGWMELWIKRKA